MKNTFAPRHDRSRGLRSQRGSVLITALGFAIILAIVLVSYLKLSTNSLRLAHRTFFADAANNIAETGLEEAVWSFNTMGNSSDPTTVANAWSSWTRGNSVADVYMSNLGSGYTSAPTVTFSGGGGTGAAGYATITTIYNIATSQYITQVSSVTITNPGSGYTTAPAVSLSGGGGSGAYAVARIAATRTITFPQLDQNAVGTAKVWVAGYDGTAVVPIIVAKATITPYDGPPIEKYIKVILSKNGALPKGVVSKNGINWNGHPYADSYVSSATPGVPPFANWSTAIARANTTVASLYGQIDLSQGTVDGNVMTGPGVTVVGHGTITGQQIGNFSYNFNMPNYPTNSGSTAGYDLGGTLPGTLPRGSDVPASDGKYYYYVHNCTIGSTAVTAGKNIVIVGNSGTQMVTGFNVGSNATQVGSATIYMDGPITESGNDAINTTSWAGALQVYTTTTSDCSFSGNAKFYGCLYAPNARLVGNGSGNSQEDLCGSFVVGYVTSNGHMNFHYDEGLKNMTTGKPWALSLWTELQTSDDRALYASKFNF